MTTRSGVQIVNVMFYETEISWNYFQNVLWAKSYKTDAARRRVPARADSRHLTANVKALISTT